MKWLWEFLELPNSERNRRLKYEVQRLRELGGRRRKRATPWRYMPRYRKILLVLAWVGIIALLVFCFMPKSAPKPNI
jgi:hypothetical protein